LGHELTHGFDDIGRQFDKHGNKIQWWTNQTVREYINLTECFVKQYSKYYLEEIGEYVSNFSQYVILCFSQRILSRK
jgi:predicted metalloendopeptidase